MCNQPDATPIASPRERFDLGIQMLKGYYDALEARAERTSVLLVGVVGWIITSPSARESLAKYRPLFYGATLSLTLFLVMAGANIWHFMKRWRDIQSRVEGLNYAEFNDFSRYRLPQHLYGVPVFFIYAAPILILYLLILFLLIYFRFKISGQVF